MTRVLIAILGAGESRRMGRPKLCLPWGHTTILGHIIDRWREAGAEDLLVIHALGGDTPVACELQRLGLRENQRTATLAPERGMMGSVITAARHALALPELTHLVITLGDQPQVRTATLRTMLTACEISPGKIVRPVYEGKAGHPFALPAAILPDLCATEAATLRDFMGLQKLPVADLTCLDSGILLDIDTPGDYDHAQQTFKTPLT